MIILIFFAAKFVKMNRLLVVLFILLNLGRFDCFKMNCKEAIEYLIEVTCIRKEAIAEGSQGKVFLLKDNLAENENTRILKVQELEEVESAIGAIHERYVLSKLKHPNIIQLYKNFQANGYFFELMEYGKKGTLTDFIGENPVYFENRNKVLKMFVDIVGAVEYMHHEGWMHADLKSENVVIGIGNEVKLIDFDVSLRLGSRNSRRGTLFYMEPELLREDTSTFLFDAPVDVYALGIILYQMAFENELPFYSDSDEVLLNLIRMQEFTFPINSDLEICYLIHGCLRGDRQERFSVVKLLEIAKQAMENKSPEKLKKTILVSGKKILDKEIFGKVVEKYKNVDELIWENEKAIKMKKKKGKADRFIFGSLLVFLLLLTVLGVAGYCTFYKREARIEDTLFGVKKRNKDSKIQKLELKKEDSFKLRLKEK